MARYRNVVTGAIVNVPEEKGERLDGYVPAGETPKKPAAKKAPAKKAPAKPPASKPPAKTGTAAATPDPKVDDAKSPADES